MKILDTLLGRKDLVQDKRLDTRIKRNEEDIKAIAAVLLKGVDRAYSDELDKVRKIVGQPPRTPK